MSMIFFKILKKKGKQLKHVANSLIKVDSVIVTQGFIIFDLFLSILSSAVGLSCYLVNSSIEQSILFFFLRFQEA